MQCKRAVGGAGKASQRARYRVKVIIYEISALRYHAFLRIPIMGSGCVQTNWGEQADLIYKVTGNTDCRSGLWGRPRCKGAIHNKQPTPAAISPLCSAAGPVPPRAPVGRPGPPWKPQWFVLGQGGRAVSAPFASGLGCGRALCGCSSPPALRPGAGGRYAQARPLPQDGGGGG